VSGVEESPRRSTSGVIGVVEATTKPNVESLLREHVTLQVDCIDRLYLN
jgi:hypothetical protein